MKNTIKGLHLLMPANEKGGSSKTTTLAEIAAGLKKLGVPMIVVNVEVYEDALNSNQSLHDMLRGTNITDLDCLSVENLRRDFGAVMDAAEDKAVILLDVPAALNSQANLVWKHFVETDYLEDFDTVTLVGTVSTNVGHFKTALKITGAIDHPNKHIMYRGWSDDYPATKLEDLPIWQKVAAKYPSIIMDRRDSGCEKCIKGIEEYAEYPGLIELRDWFAKESLSVPRPHRKVLARVLRAVDKMAAFLDKNYLPKIVQHESAKEVEPAISR